VMNDTQCTAALGGQGHTFIKVTAYDKSPRNDTYSLPYQHGDLISVAISTECNLAEEQQMMDTTDQGFHPARPRCVAYPVCHGARRTL